ncbi:MAG: type II toxin-antitoxin system VapC family toxin [Acidimicrobiia bacterium]|nr:type II toxin-antitoxin system VapC family toxin [Acidimicrobiia bacterium]
MRAVDTNVLVRLMARDDAAQVAAAEAFVAPGAWVPHLAVAEAAWVLASVYGRGPDAIAGAVDMLLNHECLAVQDEDVVAAAVAQFRKAPKVGFSDCLMLEVTRKAGHLPLRALAGIRLPTLGRRGARIARREEGAGRVPVTDEQRREAGGIVGRDGNLIPARALSTFDRDLGRVEDVQRLQGMRFERRTWATR